MYCTELTVDRVQHLELREVVKGTLWTLKKLNSIWKAFGYMILAGFLSNSFLNSKTEE